MFRARIERLEDRKLFSVTDLILDPMVIDGTSNTLMFGENVSSLDTWEHAYSIQQGPATNGIIAVLIGLAADPSDPSGNTAGVKAGAADGSARRVAASLIASDEYFSRFSNTTFDDEALVATTFGRGMTPSSITHDAEFEKWASASRFDRGSLPPAFYDLLISSILHEDNEFSFPRV